MKAPRITVVMPVYNAEEHVAEAANSVLRSSYQDIELLAINDGSTDNSRRILESIADRRLRIVDNDENLGTIATLNRGLDLATGEFIARMDADDVCTRDRLAKQLSHMELADSLGLSGTWVITFGSRGRSKGKAYLNAARIRAELFAYNAFWHPTVMMRRRFFLDHDLRYSASAPYAEDMDLWIRATEIFQADNIPVVGLHYRVHGAQVSTKYALEQLGVLAELRRQQLLRLLPKATEREIELHLHIFDVNRFLSYDILIEAAQWLEHLYLRNQHVHRYDDAVFREFLIQRWINAAHRCTPRGAQVWRAWRRSPLSGGGPLAALQLFAKQCFPWSANQEIDH